MEVHRSIEIAAPPERIWPLLVEPNSVRKWYVTLKEFSYAGDRHRGPGTRVHIEEKAAGPMLMKLDFEATEWVENRSVALHMVAGSGVKAYDQRWTLEPIAGGSRFTFDERVELPFGAIGKLLGAVGQRTSEGHVTEMLAKLKNLAES